MSGSLGIPPGFETVNPGWLSAALRGGGTFFTGDDGEVIGIRRAPSPEGIAVTSRVARFCLDLRPAGAGPSGILIKLVNPEWTHGPAPYEREVRFYRELAASHDLPAPRCYYADYEPETGRFVLLLEDLGEARPGHRLDGLAQVEAEAVFDAVADWHTAWWESAELEARDWPEKAYTPEQARRILATFHERWPRFVEMGKYEIPENLDSSLDRIDHGFVSGLTGLSRGPRTLVHSDLHAENLILDTTPGGRYRVVAVDWQNAAFANPVFDVIQVLVGLRSELLPENREHLLDRYHRRLAVPGYDRRRLDRDVIAAMRWLFVGLANWLVVFEVESLRDAATVQGHWKRLSRAMTAIGDSE